MNGDVLSTLTTTNGIYILQVIISGIIALVTTRRWTSIATYPIMLWMAGCIFLVGRYGIDGQLIFYSNDQQYYSSVVADVLASGVPIDVDWLLSASRLPFTLPAIVLAYTGIPTSLALKCVSLGYFLATIRLVLNVNSAKGIRHSIAVLYLSGLGVIGVFFSLLAQRETSMMFFAVLFFFGKSPATRLTAAVMLLLLRPHLAVAMIVGLAIVSAKTSTSDRWSPWRGSIALVLGSIAGYFLYVVGLWYQTGISNAPGHSWGIQPTLRIFSNFIGLQFLTANSDTVELSIGALLFSRIFFSETVVIPLLFFVTVITSRTLTWNGRWVLWSFAIYVGLVTNTDFNSFRQNIPFIPALGAVILCHSTLVSRMSYGGRSRSVNLQRATRNVRFTREEPVSGCTPPRNLETP